MIDRIKKALFSIFSAESFGGAGVVYEKVTEGVDGVVVHTVF